MGEARSRGNQGTQFSRVVKSMYLSQVLGSNPEFATYCDPGQVTFSLCVSVSSSVK